MPNSDQDVVDSRTGALAIFVKTPGLSRIKTRLAEKLGQVETAEFYRLAVAAVQAVAQSASAASSENGLPGLTPYWAVAELEGLDAPEWQAFPRVFQGTGDLGTRLHSVYRQLLARHPFVLLIGADSPQLPLEILQTSRTAFASSKNHLPPAFLLGRTDDGGYYLFGGCQPVPQELWEAVPYSVEITAQEFAGRLEPLGEIQELPWSFDVDTVDDLRQLSKMDDTACHLMEEQRRIIRWAKSVVPQ